MKKLLLLFLVISLLIGCREEKIILNPCPILEIPLTSNCTPYSPEPEPIEVFKVVENMPTFPGCEGILNKSERNQCATDKMIDFINEKLIYPKTAIENNIEGTVVITFLVKGNGCLEGIKVLRALGCGCSEEAVRLVSEMPLWNPGQQRGDTVEVQYNLPIRFKL